VNKQLINRQALLSNFGVNTSQLVHDINKLPSSEPPKSRRKRHVAQASRVAPAEVGGAYGTNDGDVKAWGRNWHETVILSGIEMQRQRVSLMLMLRYVADSIDCQGIQRTIPTANASQLGAREVEDPSGRAGSDRGRSRQTSCIRFAGRSGIIIPTSKLFGAEYSKIPHVFLCLREQGQHGGPRRRIGNAYQDAPLLSCCQRKLVMSSF
jgi:hypothetical protein